MIQTNQTQQQAQIPTKKDRKKDRKSTTPATENGSNDVEMKEDTDDVKQPTSKKLPIKQDQKISKEHGKMLNAFWKLSEFNQNTRLDAVQQIAKYFTDLDLSKDKENCNYVLNRLIRGLGSNRKCSRIGFSCCLTELINLKDTLHFDYLIDLAKSNLKCTNDSTLTKEELRHMQIGLVFVYLCWIQSNRLLTTNEQTLKTIITDLNTYRTNAEFKTYIQQLYLQALIILIKKLNTNFMHTIFSILDQDLKENWDHSEDTSVQKIKDNLNLLLACLNKNSEVTSEYLKKNNLKLKSIFSTKKFDLFYDILSQSTESLPNLQPICAELVQYLAVNNSVYFKQFWSDLVDSKLASKRDLEKKCLSFKLFLFSLGFVNSENYKIVFYESLLASVNVLKMFVLSYANKHANLSELVRDEISKGLIEVVRQKESELASVEEASLGADLIIKILGYVRNYHEISDLVSPLISVLNKQSLNKLFDFMINDFISNDLEEFSKIDKSEQIDYEIQKEELISKETWMLNQITNLAKNTSTFGDENLIKKVLSYVSIHSYFDVTGAQKNKKIENFQIGSGLVKNEKMITNFRERLIEYIGVILYKNNQSADSKVCSYTVIAELVASVKGLIDTQTSVRLTEKLLKKEKDIKELSARVSKMLNDLVGNTTKSNKTLDEANLNVFQTFFMCISIEFFRMFDSIKNTKQTLDDIEICMQKFNDEVVNINTKPKTNKKKNKQKKSEDEDEEFEWIDVLVEMLLNLFTINTSWIRNAVKNQFRKLLPKLTVKSVKLIVDLLNPEAEEDLLEEDDDDMEHDGQETEEDTENVPEINGDLFLTKNNGKNEEEESGIEDLSMSPSSLNGKSEIKKKRKEVEEESEESEDDDDDDDEEEEAEEGKSGVDEELKNSLLKALGNAVADEKDDDGSDLDDDAMLKLDETIAQAFRLKSQDKKRQNELIQYKLRVLDLIQELFKSTHRLDLITYLISPMLEILFDSQTKPNLKQISQRILGFLVNVKNTTKKINESKLPPVDELFEVLSHLIKCSTTHFNVTNTLIETSMFCVRLIQHSANQCADEVEKNKILKKLNDVYSDIIKNDKTKVNPVMYKEYLIRYPVYSIPLIVQMIDTASMPDVKLHKKTMTLITLYQCVNSQMFNSSVDSKNSSLFIEKIFKFFDMIVDDIIKDDNLHIKFVDAFLNLVTRVLNLPKNLLKKELNEKLASKLTVFTKESKVKQAYKSRFLNLIQICHRPLTTTNK